MRSLGFLCLFVCTAAFRANAQAYPQAGLRSVQVAPLILRRAETVVNANRTNHFDRLSPDSIRASHWKKGALIGALVGLPIGFVAFSSFGDGSTGSHIGQGILGGLGMAALTGLIGGLIGSLFPASHVTPTSASLIN